MENRILSREEWETLSPDTIELIYKHIHRQYVSSDVIEKVLLQAVILARLNQCCVDAGTLSLLLEKVSEYEGVSFPDPEEDEKNFSRRYC